MKKIRQNLHLQHRLSRLKKKFLGSTLIMILALNLLTGFSYISSVDNKPNIIVFYVDDLGWTDLACYGSQFYETPNIDAFRQQAEKFTMRIQHAPCALRLGHRCLPGNHPLVRTSLIG